MSTRRSNNRVTELAGVNYVQQVVQRYNCIFQPIALENDQGNDGFIEFINENVATSFCIFVQIKSGQSYKTAKSYKIPADKNHLKYWNNALNPIVGIVYDSNLNKGFWVNISEYLKTHQEELYKDTHSVNIPVQNEFTLNTFEEFKQRFCNYISEYKSNENYGRSLEQYANFDNPLYCYEAVKSLYCNHRDKKATWLYLICNFGNITERAIIANLLGLISNNLDNPDVFWHSGNIKYLPLQSVKDYIPELIAHYFGEREIRKCIPFMRSGVVRGSFPFLVFKVLDMAKDVDNVLLKMVFDERPDSDDRSFLFWLFIHFAQKKSVEYTLNMVERYFSTFPPTIDSYIIEGMRDTILEQGFIDIG